MQGHLVFRDLTFNNILKKLERHYNVEIINFNEVIGNEVFNARFDSVAIEEVLGYFNDIHSIDFRIEENKVIIK
jgi:ferric-dicitrate binding protein FerR (iron transport regulator)